MKCSSKNCRGEKNVVADMANVGTLCEDCRTEIEKALKRQGVTTGTTDFAGFLDDYIKLYMILSSDQICLAKAQKFGEYITHCTEKRGLSYHLKKYETICQFPDVEVIPTGVLSSTEFYDMIARGVMWKDVGAGLTHGLYAHRLQWHFVLAVITSDFTVAKTAGWDHGGYDLFVSLGEGDARTYNLWGKIFDASGSYCFRAPEEVEPKLKDIKPIAMLIDKKYEKYAKEFKAIQTYAQGEAMQRVQKGLLQMKDANRVSFDLTDATWGAYFFARRGITDAVPKDLTDYWAYLKSKGQWMLNPWSNYLPAPDDPSKRFRKDAIVLEHGNKILRVAAQKMPTMVEVTGLRGESGANLKVVNA